jgi:hypothetical protein
MQRTNDKRVFCPVFGDLFAALLEQRMAEHKKWQHEAVYIMVEEIIAEVQALPKRKPTTARLFELLPEHVQGSIVVDLERKQ